MYIHYIIYAVKENQNQLRNHLYHLMHSGVVFFYNMYYSIINILFFLAIKKVIVGLHKNPSPLFVIKKSSMVYFIWSIFNNNTSSVKQLSFMTLIKFYPHLQQIYSSILASSRIFVQLMESLPLKAHLVSQSFIHID